MATTTTNFGLKKYEGTDLFNPLTFENPNTDDIDAAMFYNKQHNCVDATELTTGTVHAITKTDLDSPLFSFSATSVYHYGDTFTLNGSPVTALLTSGEVLPEGAYVIGSRVLGFVSGGGSLITFYVMKTTDLAPINNIIGNKDISGIADGTLTGAVDMLNTNLANKYIKTRFVEKTVTIPAATNNFAVSFATELADIDSDDILTMIATNIGSFSLPYISVGEYTAVYSINKSTKTFNVNNTASAWTDYKFRALVFYV